MYICSSNPNIIQDSTEDGSHGVNSLITQYPGGGKTKGETLGST